MTSTAIKNRKGTIAAITLMAVLATPGVVLADPPALPTPDPIPPVFCIRVTDMERVLIGDGTPSNDFVFQFEILNWSDKPASGFSISSTIGSTNVNGTNPTIYGIGVDRDGRGGALGGSDIDASGAGITSGAGTFDATAIHSGRGRGDVGGALNDWNGTTFNATSGLWNAGAGTAIVPQDLIAAGATGGQKPADLIPSQTPPFTVGDLDLLGDSSIDGGPGTIVADDTTAPLLGKAGTGNVLDGFTVTVQDWDVGEILSLNWFLVDNLGDAIGTAGFGNQFGFGMMNLARIPLGGALPPGVFVGNTGFLQNNGFYDSVNLIPNPSEFAMELGVGITGSFASPSDNIFNARVNTRLPAPALWLLIISGLIPVFAVGRCARRRLYGAEKRAGEKN